MTFFSEQDLAAFNFSPVLGSKKPNDVIRLFL